MIATIELIPRADGLYEAKMRLRTHWVRMGEAAIKELGLGINYHTLRRLMTAGFVRSAQITPGQYALDLQSWYQHCDKCRANPEFWAKGGQNLKRYMKAL